MEKLTISRKFARLETKDFTIFANQRGYESEIAEYVVPAKRMIEIPNDFIGLKLMTGDRFTFTTGVGETTRALVLTYPIARDSLIPLVGQNVIVVRRTPAPVIEWTTFSVTEPRTVTLTGLLASTAYVFDVYYLFGVGSVNITVISADETARTKILESAIRKINMLNQEDVRMGLKPGMVGLCIPERYKIQVRVNTPAPVILFDPVVDAGARSRFARESFIELPVNVSDLLQWPEDIERYAKQQLMAL
ncbi:MAG: hypothetical protein DDT23_00851 [candidate division WS2 bacterium]|nr:hypothetical protein [Candidatus Lithacetigena glycinireducens]